MVSATRFFGRYGVVGVRPKHSIPLPLSERYARDMLEKNRMLSLHKNNAVTSFHIPTDARGNWSEGGHVSGDDVRSRTPPYPEGT